MRHHKLQETGAQICAWKGEEKPCAV